MKTLNINFEDKELEYIIKIKNQCGASWKDLILQMAAIADKQELRTIFYLKHQKEINERGIKEHDRRKQL